MIFWITGKKNAGKTTAARQLVHGYASIGESLIILDGDDVREAMGTSGADQFTHEARRNNQVTMASFAIVLVKQGFHVAIPCVSPSSEIRKECFGKFKKAGVAAKLICITGGTLWEGTTYDQPGDDEPHQTYKGNE